MSCSMLLRWQAQQPKAYRADPRKVSQAQLG